MLSHIYRIANEFKREHGYPPNVLYLNPGHLQRLLSEFGANHDLNFVTRFLGMEILIFPDHAHTQVSLCDPKALARGTNTQ